MATSTVYASSHTSKYFLNPQAHRPSPPADYLYGKVAYPSTSPMTNTPPNVSPTSQHNVQVRQLRQPRQPLYVPAALRPTNLPSGRDIPGRPRAPDTPPTSQSNSWDSAKSSSQALHTVVSNDSGSDAASRLYRGLSGSSEGLEESTADVTGPPTTAHWKPDASSDNCSVCGVLFTWYFRRHHCRRCGSLVCENHIKAKVPLDQNARLNTKGVPSKACNPCSDEWRFLKKLRNSRASSVAESQNSSQGTAMPAPAISIPQSERLLAPDAQRVGSMARSEGGMIWSTF